MKKFVILIFCCTFKVSFGKLPATIPVCRRNHPNMSQCIANAIEKLKPQLASGDFGSGYIAPKLEPMFVKEMDFGEIDGNEFRLFGVNIYGTTGFKVEKLRSNMNDLKFDALITIPKLTTTAKYQLLFNFFGSKLKTNGDYLIIHENMKVVIPIRLKRVIQNGIEFIKIDPIAVQILQYKVKQAKFSNLFGGNKTLEEIINALFLSNADFNKVRPVIEKSLSTVFTEVANKILESTSFDEMFPL